MAQINLICIWKWQYNQQITENKNNEIIFF